MTLKALTEPDDARVKRVECNFIELHCATKKLIVHGLANRKFIGLYKQMSMVVYYTKSVNSTLIKREILLHSKTKIWRMH